jgi:hypothetical protein
MKAFPTRIAMVALAVIASLLFAPTKSNAQVKGTAAALGFKAAKIEVVFRDAVKLAESIQKVGYRPDEDPAEFIKKYVTHLLTQAGVEVKDEAEEGDTDITYYVGFDDADDDNDGTPDASDSSHFSGEAPDGVKNTDIEDVDVDAESAEARALPNPDKTKGIYVLMVNKTDGSVAFYHQAEDVLGYYKQSGDGPSAMMSFPSVSHLSAESNHANLIRRPQFGGFGYGSPLWCLTMSLPSPACR